MHKLLITDPKGVVINTKHYPLGTILPNVPDGIAKACVHFKQAKDIGGSLEVTEKASGTPLEQFTLKLKAVLEDDYELEEDEAAELIKAHTHLVGLGALGGDAAVTQTAFALVQAAGRIAPAGSALPGAPLSMQPASRLPVPAGSGPVAGGGTLLTQQPTAPLPGAPPADVNNRPSEFQETTLKAEEAEIGAAADEQVAINFEAMTIPQLREYAVGKNIPIASGLSKAGIVSVLEEASRK